MRITGGEARGTHIRAPAGGRTRPTADRVREAMFNILGHTVAGARVLDLFAGSGALAIEALSRGAEYAVLVEKETSAIRTIRLNLERSGLAGRAKILRIDFRSALAKLVREREVFDLIFIDPPYERDLLGEVAASLASHRVTSSESRIVVEHFRKTPPPENISGIPLYDTRNYGQTAVSFFLDAPHRPDRSNS